MKGASIITMQGSEVLEKADILVRDGRIAKIANSIERPDAMTLDLSGSTIIPGFIDSHCHVDNPAIEQPWSLANFLAWGVTTCRDPYSSFELLEFADLIDAGEVVGPRVITTGPGINWHDQVQSQEDADSIAAIVANDYGMGWLKTYLVDRLQHQWLAKAARRYRLNPVDEGTHFWRGLSFIADGYPEVAHSFPNQRYYKDLRQLIARSGFSIEYQFGSLANESAPSAEHYFMGVDDIYNNELLRKYMPIEYLRKRMMRTASVFHDEEHTFPVYAKAAQSLIESGGLVSLSGHGWWGGYGMHWELRAMAMGGSNHNALLAATALAAESLGLADLGVVREGALADLIILAADPLDNIEHASDIRYVVKGGQIFDPLAMKFLDPGAQPYEFWWNDRPDLEIWRPGAEKTGGIPQSSR